MRTTLQTRTNGEQRARSRVKEEMRQDAPEQTRRERLRRKAKPSGMGQAVAPGTTEVAEIAEVQQNERAPRPQKE